MPSDYHQAAHSFETGRTHSCPGVSWRSGSPSPVPSSVFSRLARNLTWALVGATVVLLLLTYYHIRSPCQEEASAILVHQSLRTWRAKHSLPLSASVQARLPPFDAVMHGSGTALDPARTRELQRLQVTALVFYGRRRNVRLLNRYLERNLASAGGILHEVVFVVKTEDAADIAFLRELIGCHRREYRAVFPPLQSGEHQWAQHYGDLYPGRLYIKMDDDIVFIQEGAIEALVEAKLQSRFLFLSANVVNHPLLSAVHARLGALLPFTPTVDTWCTSDDVAACAASNRARSCSGSDCDWHLVRDADGGPATLDGSPAGNATYGDPLTCFLWDWKCAAIAHHSFLHRWRAGSLDAFEFSSWDFDYAAFDRWSINFFIFNSSDVPPPPLPTDDEVFLGQHLPAHLHKHCGAAGRCTLVVHFGYYPQTDQLLQYTNLLQKYNEVSLALNGKGHPKCGFDGIP